MSSVSIASFRWLDALEKEFDNAYVDIDLLFNELQNDSDNGDLSDELLADIVESSRDKLKIMCSAWSQLVHKSQTIFQVNCKYEAQLVDLRSSLVEANGFKQASEKELEKLLIELHTAQLQTQRLKSSGSSSSLASAPLSPSATTTSDMTTDIIQKKLDEELKRRFSSDNLDFNLALLKAELSEYKKENQSYKEQFVNMYSEINGARLAAKYLDKELAGRIQQIQLFGKNLKSDEHERLWNQLEAEIHLHRHKTVVKACLNKKIKQKTNLISSQEQESSTSFNQSNNISKDTVKKDKKLDISNEKRVVSLKRTDVKEPLGLSITGGNEHGVPIIISEIHEDGVAARNGQLFIGDSIVKVESNKKVYDLREVMHAQAVEILSSLTGIDVDLTVYYMQPEYDESDDEKHSVGELSYPFLDSYGQLHLKNSNAINKEMNGSIKSTSSDINEKTNDSTSLLKEYQKSSPKAKKASSNKADTDYSETN